MADINYTEGFVNRIKELYGECNESVQNRFEELLDMYVKCFNTSDVEFYSAPGRIEIVGNHTDHNGGKVLCAAINFDTLAAAAKRTDGKIEVKSLGYPMLKVDTADTKFEVSEVGTSTALIKGVVDYYIKHGKAVGGFSATMSSTVPSGSGVSSSSSFELVIAEILNVMYNDSKLDPIFKAKAAQYAENSFFGKPCGLMDQSAIALGGVNEIDFKNFDEPIIERAEWKFDDLDIYVISTGGDHANLTDDYAAIPKEMKDVAALFGARVLAEIPYEKWLKDKDNIVGKVSRRSIDRAEHFFEENIRVENAVKAIDSGDRQAFLDIVNASGLSSRYKLQNTYSPAGKSKNLENALDRVQKIEGVLASRVHGGGFAGTILVFANRDAGVRSALDVMFGESNVFELSIRKSGAIRINLEK